MMQEYHDLFKVMDELHKWDIAEAQNFKIKKLNSKMYYITAEQFRYFK